MPVKQPDAKKPDDETSDDKNEEESKSQENRKQNAQIDEQDKAIAATETSTPNMDHDNLTAPLLVSQCQPHSTYNLENVIWCAYTMLLFVPTGWITSSDPNFVVKDTMIRAMCIVLCCVVYALKNSLYTIHSWLNVLWMEWSISVWWYLQYLLIDVN